VHAQTMKTRPFSPPLLGPGNEARPTSCSTARHTTHLGCHQIGRFEFLKFHVRKVIQLHCRNTNQSTSQIQLQEHETLLSLIVGLLVLNGKVRESLQPMEQKICLSSSCYHHAKHKITSIVNHSVVKSQDWWAELA